MVKSMYEGISTEAQAQDSPGVGGVCYSVDILTDGKSKPLH